MSTKKEKCCECPEKPDLCRGECMCHHSQSERSGFELDNASMGVSASTHIQSESIEWEEVQEVHSEVIKVMESIGFGLLLDGQTFYKKGYELKPREHTTFSMTQAYEIKNAITTAVAKRELKIAEEVKGKVYSGELSETDSNTVLSIIKH